MKTEKMKEKYCKPAFRVVEWDFNESICSRIIVNSVPIKIKKEYVINATELRNDTSDPSWTWRP